MSFLRRYRLASPPQYQLIHAEAPNLSFDLDDSAVTVTVDVRAHHPVMGALVDLDGQLLPIGTGTTWSWTGPREGFSKINLSVKKGEDIAYAVTAVGPSRRWERVDPSPVALSRATHVNPTVPQAIRDYIDAALKQRGLPISADELLENVEEDWDFEESEPFANFGPGSMEDDDPSPSRPSRLPPAQDPETEVPGGPPKARRQSKAAQRPAPDADQLDIEDAISESGEPAPRSTST